MHIRIFMVLVLAAFAAGTVVHAAIGTTMSVKMAIAATDGADMDDCQDCANGNDTPSLCDSVCVPPIFAVVSNGQIHLSQVKTAIRNTVTYNMIGRPWPPEPYPPRSTT